MAPPAGDTDEGMSFYMWRQTLKVLRVYLKCILTYFDFMKMNLFYNVSLCLIMGNVVCEAGTWEKTDVVKSGGDRKRDGGRVM